jgi:hypothetical protein
MSDEARPPLAWEECFIAALRLGEKVHPAARAAGISHVRAYAHRKTSARFAGEWAGAIAAWKAEKARRGQWREIFLQTLADTSHVTAAAAAAGISTRFAYRFRRSDREFAAEWRAALREGYDNLELELLGHLRDPQPGRKMEVSAAVRLLSAHRATVEHQRALDEEEDVEAVRASLDRFIDAIRVNRAASAPPVIEDSSNDPE